MSDSSDNDDVVDAFFSDDEDMVSDDEEIFSDDDELEFDDSDIDDEDDNVDDDEADEIIASLNLTGDDDIDNETQRDSAIMIASFFNPELKDQADEIRRKQQAESDRQKKLLAATQQAKQPTKPMIIINTRPSATPSAVNTILTQHPTVQKITVQQPVQQPQVEEKSTAPIIASTPDIEQLQRQINNKQPSTDYNQLIIQQPDEPDNIYQYRRGYAKWILQFIAQFNQLQAETIGYYAAQKALNNCTFSSEIEQIINQTATVINQKIK